MDTFEKDDALNLNESVLETDSSGVPSVVPDPIFSDGALDVPEDTLNDPFVFEAPTEDAVFESAESPTPPPLDDTLTTFDPTSVFASEETPVETEAPFVPEEPLVAPVAFEQPVETPEPVAPVPSVPMSSVETVEPALAIETVSQSEAALHIPPRNKSEPMIELETHEMGMQPSVPESETEPLPETVELQSAPETVSEPVMPPVVNPKKNEADSFTDRESPLDTTPQTPKKIDYTSNAFIKELFDNGNMCITAPDGSFPVKEDTRQLLALFSNGRFFVSETYKFDGKVLGFEYLAKKRRLQIGKAEYIPMNALTSIYEYAAQARAASQNENEVDTGQEQEQARMQRDFVTIVSRAAMNHVSDIHIVVSDHTTVMFRVNGLMQTEMEYNKEWGESFVRAAFASSDISDANYAQNEYQAAQKLGRTPLRGSGGKLVLPKNLLGIRLQFNPIAFGTRYVVMRLLYAEENAQSAGDLNALGFTDREKDLFYKLRSMPTGIVVISGPTGSGKSTTLQRNMISMLQERNYEINLITVEDPPEYPIPGARQMPVTNASIEEAKDREFTKALSAALRSDPDALMIGEIRSLSAADLAFRGALSGHNVWTTLHANSAPAILMRFKDMGVEDFKLRDPDIMKGLLAQRLFRTLCPHCRLAAKDNLKHPSVVRLRNAFGDVGLEHAYLRGPGCKECDMRGVKGRMAVAELILPDAPFLDLMMKGETQKALTYWINDLQGMTLRETAQDRMLRGLIDIEEVERWTGLLDQVVTV